MTWALLPVVLKSIVALTVVAVVGILLRNLYKSGYNKGYNKGMLDGSRKWNQEKIELYRELTKKGKVVIKGRRPDVPFNFS